MVQSRGWLLFFCLIHREILSTSSLGSFPWRKFSLFYNSTVNTFRQLKHDVQFLTFHEKSLHSRLVQNVWLVEQCIVYCGVVKGSELGESSRNFLAPLICHFH